VVPLRTSGLRSTLAKIALRSNAEHDGARGREPRFIGRFERLADFHAPEDDVGLVGLRAAQALGLLRDRVGGMGPARRVDQFDMRTVEVEAPGEVVASGAGLGADERLRPAGESVEQAAFAGVRAPTSAARIGRPLTVRLSSCRRRLASRASAAASRVSVSGLPTNSIGSSEKSSAASVSASRFNRFIAQGMQRLRDPAGELRQGVLQVRIGAGLDDRMDGLGLRQIEFSRRGRRAA